MSLKYLAAAAAVLATTLAAPSSRQAATKDIVDLAAGTDSLKILVELVTLADLGATLKGDGPFTVFAPTDDAFAKTAKALGYPAKDNDETIASLTEAFTKLAKSKKQKRDAVAEIKDVLLYHVLPVKNTFKQLLSRTTLATALDSTTIERGQKGVSAESLKDKSPGVPDPEITAKDIMASNGIVHTINSVLLPFDVTADTLKLIGGPAASMPDGSPTTSPTTTAAGAKTTTSSDAKTTTSDDTKTTTSDDADPESTDDDDDVCFPMAAVVHMEDGTEVAMHSLEAGHMIATGSGDHSAVFAFSHRTLSGLHPFVRIEAASGRFITLSKNHYLYANGKLAAAETVRVGDELTTIEGVSRVVKTSVVFEEGLVAPHTMHGDVLVNGVRASTYTRTVHPTIAHALLAPVRMIVRMGLSAEPLGSLLYGGAGSAAKAMPRGD